MATQNLKLTRTPQSINTGANGIRIQSMNGNVFYWSEVSSAPTNLNLGFKDSDVWISANKSIYVWSVSGDVNVMWG